MIRASQFRVDQQPQQRLVSITPPRRGEAALTAIENSLDALPQDYSVSLEMAASNRGISLLARYDEMSLMRRMLTSHYPQAVIDEMPPAEDPLIVHSNERAWTRTLRVAGPEYLPIRHSLDDLTERGADPILTLFGAIDSLNAGERVLTRIVLSPIEHDWAAQYHELGMMGAGSLNQTVTDHQRDQQNIQNASGGDIDAKLFIPLAILAIGGLYGYQLYQADDMLKLYGFGAAGIAAVALAGAGWWWFFRGDSGPILHDPKIVQERLSRLAFESHIEIVVIQNDHIPDVRAMTLLDTVTAAYSHYDHPLGAHLAVESTVEGAPSPQDALKPLAPPPVSWKNLFRSSSVSRSLLSAREIAALWHPPAQLDDVHAIGRAGARALAASPTAIETGAYVGTTTARPQRPVRLPDETTNANMFFVARSGMGKSTLMNHVVEHRLQRKAAGLDDDAIVVVDPHTDLVYDIIERVPESLIDRVWLIDLSDEEHTPGVNILDTHIFTDRDRTTDSVMAIAKGIWEQWGPRMQGITEHLVKSIYEINAHPSVPRDQQLTLLDGVNMLQDENFQRLAKSFIKDPYLKDYWDNDFAKLNPHTRQEMIAPVLNRLRYYSSSTRARAILGQSRSTIDIQKVIEDGDVLLVASAQSAVGENVAQLVGASILNLIDDIIRAQGTKASGSRRGVTVVCDEMQTIPGVNFESMLSEVRKYGGNLVLATQSLTRLDELSPTMRDAILSNCAGLAVMQVSAIDAQRLLPELNSESLDIDDITGLDAHNAYMRIRHRNSNVVFSMEIRKPDPVDEIVVKRVRERVADYTAPTAEVQRRLEARAGDGHAILRRIAIESGDPDLINAGRNDMGQRSSGAESRQRRRNDYGNIPERTDNRQPNGAEQRVPPPPPNFFVEASSESGQQPAPNQAETINVERNVERKLSRRARRRANKANSLQEEGAGDD